MRAFEYVAADAGGRSVAGVAWASDELELDATLEGRGLVLTRAKVVSDEHRKRTLGLRNADLILLTTQLATITAAGVPLLEGLNGLRARATRASVRRLLDEMISALSGGGALSTVLGQYPRAFPPVYRAAVVAGEASGALDRILRRLATHMEWVRGMRATTVQALVYPAVLAVALLVLIGILLFFLLPRIVSLFPGGSADLPAQTRFVLGVSGFLRANAIWLGLGLAAGVTALVSTLRTPHGRAAASRALNAVPVVGAVARAIATSKFACTAAILQGAGCNAFSVLEVAGDASGNPEMTAAIRRASERVKGGARLSEALEAEPVVDPLLLQLVAVGEKTGKLDECLERVVEHYDQELPRSVKRMLSLLEPGLLLVAGAVVAFLLLAALLPIFDLMETLG